MKIALLHYSSPPIVGGVESVLAQHARMMTLAGHSVAILVGRGETFDDAIPVRVLPHLDSRDERVMAIKRELDIGRHTPAFDALRDEIQQELVEALDGYDVLIAHNVASLHKNLALTAALWQASQLPGFPRLILWHHDLAWTTPRYRSELHTGYPWDLLRSQWDGVTHVVVSELRRQELSKLLGNSLKSIRVVPNGVDLNIFYKLDSQTIAIATALNLFDADPLLLLPVRLTPRKNIELALQTLAELRHRYPRAMLLVTGPEGPHNPANAAYRKKLTDLRDNLHLQGSAHFMAEFTSQFLPDAVIADFYRLSDALLFPSREEGFGIPIIEAAFSGLPVFCADIPVLRELGVDDISYFALESQPADIANQIERRLESEATSRWARRAKHTYTWDSIYRSLIEPLIQEVAK